MFDRLGRVLCAECTSQMKSIGTDDFEAAFECTNKDCGHTIRIALRPTPVSLDGHCSS